MILGSNEYSCAIDTWSLGLVFVEMITGRPLFDGKNQSQVINQIAALLGPISPNALNNMHVSKIDENIMYNPPSQAGDWSKVFKRNLDPFLIDFISKLVVWDPSERITPLKALLHPFFNILYDSKSGNEQQIFKDIFEFTQEEID